MDKENDIILPIVISTSGFIVICVCLFVARTIRTNKVERTTEAEISTTSLSMFQGTEYDISCYESWDNQQSLTWMLSVGNGKFYEYPKLLELVGFRGIFLKSIDLAYINQEWNIYGNDANLLLMKINELIIQNENIMEPGSPMCKVGAFKAGNNYDMLLKYDIESMDKDGKGASPESLDNTTQNGVTATDGEIALPQGTTEGDV